MYKPTPKQYRISAELGEAGLLNLVESGEAYFEEQLDRVGKELLSLPELHLIGLTGPTCSGKTTAAEKLTDLMQQHGKQLHVISIDDFYYNKDYLRELARKNGRNEPDFDSEETIDLEYLEACTTSLLSGRETQLPRFDFASGLREKGELITPHENDLFLFEGIQILYPGVARILSGKSYQSIFIYPFSSIETDRHTFCSDEIRLLRRLVRDVNFRATSPEFTFYIWRSVRENEDRNIFPYVQSCDYAVDSTMPYELGMLKPYLERILGGIPKSSTYSTEAKNILSRVRDIKPIPSELLPEKSLYKEFL